MLQKMTSEHTVYRIIVMSSANTQILPSCFGILRQRKRTIGSNARAKRDPLVGHPCRMPDVTRILLKVWPRKAIAISLPFKSARTALRILGQIPMRFKTACTKLCDMEGKAASISIPIQEAQGFSLRQMICIPAAISIELSCARLPLT